MRFSKFDAPFSNFKSDATKFVIVYEALIILYKAYRVAFEVRRGSPRTFFPPPPKIHKYAPHFQRDFRTLMETFSNFKSVPKGLFLGFKLLIIIYEPYGDAFEVRKWCIEVRQTEKSIEILKFFHPFSVRFSNFHENIFEHQKRD